MNKSKNFHVFLFLSMSSPANFCENKSDFVKYTKQKEA